MRNTIKPIIKAIATTSGVVSLYVASAFDRMIDWHLFSKAAVGLVLSKRSDAESIAVTGYYWGLISVGSMILAMGALLLLWGLRKEKLP